MVGNGLSGIASPLNNSLWGASARGVNRITIQAGSINPPTI